MPLYASLSVSRITGNLLTNFDDFSYKYIITFYPHHDPDHDADIGFLKELLPYRCRIAAIVRNLREVVQKAEFFYMYSPIQSTISWPFSGRTCISQLPTDYPAPFISDPCVASS